LRVENGSVRAGGGAAASAHWLLLRILSVDGKGQNGCH
jgi:hypothetical protein